MSDLSREPPEGSSSPGLEGYFDDEEDFLSVPVISEEEQLRADAQMPSPQKFNIVLSEYLRKLSPKKRDKALLTQKMYNQIVAVLHEPKDTSTKTAQFRFWAKKHFSFSVYGGVDILCHKTKPVAVKEKIFEVLIHCHAEAKHGGRDKTSSAVSYLIGDIPISY